MFRLSPLSLSVSLFFSTGLFLLLWFYLRVDEESGGDPRVIGSQGLGWVPVEGTRVVGPVDGTRPPHVLGHVQDQGHACVETGRGGRRWGLVEDLSKEGLTRHTSLDVQREIRRTV